jgi:hypothetical protein
MAVKTLELSAGVLLENLAVIWHDELSNYPIP